VSFGLRGLYGRLLALPAWLRVVALGLFLLMLGILSSTPGSSGGAPLQLRGYVLNWGHQPLYGVLALLFALLLQLRLPGAPRGRWALVLLLTIAVALADEINQSRVPQRDSSVWDLGSDILGAILALTAAGWTQRREGPLLEAGPALFCLGLSLAYNCLPAFLPNVPLTVLMP
jgi:hypothetical protein